MSYLSSFSCGVPQGSVVDLLLLSIGMGGGRGGFHMSALEQTKPWFYVDLLISAWAPSTDLLSSIVFLSL